MSEEKQEKPVAEDAVEEVAEETLDEGAEDTTEEAETDANAIISKLNAEVENLKDQVLRARAETENVRRRGEKDRSDAGAYAMTGFARDMLTILDNFNRAKEVLPEEIDESLKGYVEGVDLTYRELLKTFERHGITEIKPALGDKFDSNLHQAMFEMESEEYDKGAVANIVAPGYQIKDRLLRPAMVGVVKK